MDYPSLVCSLVNNLVFFMTIFIYLFIISACWGVTLTAMLCASPTPIHLLNPFVLYICIDTCSTLFWIQVNHFFILYCTIHSSQFSMDIDIYTLHHAIHLFIVIFPSYVMCTAWYWPPQYIPFYKYRHKFADRYTALPMKVSYILVELLSLVKFVLYGLRPISLLLCFILDL